MHWCGTLALIITPTLAFADPGIPASKIPLHQLPLDAALYCNASCSTDSCSRICPAENMCRWSCDENGHAHCGCQRGGRPARRQ